MRETDHDPSMPADVVPPRLRSPNDPGQYDDLVEEWWRPRGAFAALHWLATERGRLVPPAPRPGAVLLDVGCGGGLLAPHLAGRGYRHVGVDLGAAACRVSRTHGVEPLQADAARLPLRDASVDVVVAGEILEHVPDLDAVVAEIGRVLRPGGLLVLDTLADTRRCRFLLVTVGERLPFVPRGIHDPVLFVDPARLRRLAADAGITLELWGLQPHLLDGVRWLLRRRDDVRFRRVRDLGAVFAGRGVRETAAGPTA